VNGGQPPRVRDPNVGDDVVGRGRDERVGDALAALRDPRRDGDPAERHRVAGNRAEARIATIDQRRADERAGFDGIGLDRNKPRALRSDLDVVDTHELAIRDRVLVAGADADRAFE